MAPRNSSADPQSLIGLSAMPTSNRTRFFRVGGKNKVNRLLDTVGFISFPNLAHLSLRKIPSSFTIPTLCFRRQISIVSLMIISINIYKIRLYGSIKHLKNHTKPFYNF